MRWLVCLLVGLGVASSNAQSGWSRWRVQVETPVEADRVGDCNLQLFSDNVSLGATDLIVGPGQMIDLLALSLPVEFVEDLPAPDAWKDVITPQIDDYKTNYLRYADMIGQYEIWRAANPTKVSRTQIGTTYGNRAIWAYRISNTRGTAPEAASIVITGGIHAREWISPSVCMYLTDTLLTKINTDPVWANLMRRAALYVVPQQNPDGYEYTWTNNRFWRKNRRNNGNGTFGVDLNRNYATGWGGGGSSGNTNSDTYRGPSAFSEPETRAVRDFAHTLPNVAGFIDYHSYGQYIMWPWGYTFSLCPDDTVHRMTGNRMKAIILNTSGVNYTQGPIADTLYQASGVSVDYFYQPLGALSMTVELRDTTTFDLPPSQILPTAQENWEAFRLFLIDAILGKKGGIRK